MAELRNSEWPRGGGERELRLLLSHFTEGLEVGETEAGASEKEAFLDFRVTLQPIDKRTKMKTQASPMVFAERSRFRKVGDAWLYASGEVTSEEAGLKGTVLNGQRDLTKLEKDVEYVKGVLGEDSPFK